MPNGKLTKKPSGWTLVSGETHQVVAKNKFSPELKAKIAQGLQCDLDVEFDGTITSPMNIHPASGIDLEALALAAQQAAALAATGDFYNPYNFIHGRDRSGLPPEPEIPTGLGDREPFGHHALNQDLYTGSITIKLTTATPLLIVDAESQKVEASHPTFQMCKDAQGNPLLRPTSVKGVLSSNFEAITNSRLRVFDKHEGCLAKRMDPRKGITFVPARIAGGKIILYPGTTSISSNPAGTPTGNQMYAAWLPRYDQNHTIQPALKYASSGIIPQHEQHVECWIEEFEHHGWDRDIGKHKINFHFWRVREIVPSGTSGLTAGSLTPTTPPKAPWQPRRNYHVSTGTFKNVSGYVFISNANIGNKHDERVFFVESQAAKIDAGPAAAMAGRWKNLISDYQEIHRDEIEKKGRTGPPSMSNCVWSRHIGNGSSKHVNEDERVLDEGTLCYVQVEQVDGKWKATDIFPVNISRELFEKSPSELLTLTFLLPAESIHKLSPADRVFGWVHGDAEDGRRNDPNAVVAHKGQLRIGNVECATVDAITDFDGATIPLAILSTPKPSQASFYTMDENGLPVREKNKGYKADHQIRHRKMYPHHKLAGDPSNRSYWTNPIQDRTQTRTAGLVQEYRRPHKGVLERVFEDGHWKQRLARDDDQSFVLNLTEAGEQRTDQNRSISEWVKIETEFTCTIHITNLSQVELGALLWMLSLDQHYEQQGHKHFLRMGGAKPLGFGGVSCEITSTDLRSGEDWKSYYLDLSDAADAVDALGQNDLKSSAIAAYKLAVVAAYGSGNVANFESIDFIDAFLGCCKGFDGPVHYPRMEQWPDPDGNNFKWFGEAQRHNRNPKVGLPELTTQTPRLRYWQ